MYDPQTRFQELLVGFITSDVVVLMSFTHMVCGPNRRHGECPSDRPPTWIVDPRSPALATSTTNAPQQHKLTISFINSLLWFLLVKSFIVFCGIEISTQRFPSFTNSFFHSFTRPRLESQRPSWVSVQFQAPKRATGGAVGVEGLDPDQERSRRTAARKGNTENRGKRLTENCGACASSSSG